MLSMLAPLLLALAPAAQAAPPIELTDVTVQNLGARPPVGSGVRWVVRELVVATSAGEQRTLYLTWHGKGDFEPVVGSRCDIRARHWTGMPALVGATGTVIEEGDAVDRISCRD